MNKPEALLSEVQVTSARSLAEAYGWLGQRAPGGRVLAGGTDLMVQLNARIGLERLGPVLDVWRVPELRCLEQRGGLLVLGALTRYCELQQSALVRASFPALAEVAGEIGARAIQNRGTLGGNVCNASPAGDTLPLLLAAEARFVLGGPRGERTVPADRFFLGYRRTALAADELLLRIEVPAAPRLVYRKVGTRRAQAISKTLVAVAAQGSDGQALRGVRIAAGCVAPVPLRCRAAESVAEGRPLDALTQAQVRAALLIDIAPIDDVRSNADYRRQVTGNVLLRLLQQLVQA